MGFSLKKIVKAVAKPIIQTVTAPISIPLAIVNKTGLSEEVKSFTTVDTQNMSNVLNNTAKLQGSTGSDEFKNAAFDGLKLGIAAAGGAGAIAGTTAAGGVLLTAKAQAGGGVSVADLGTLAGVPTNIGGIDLGGLNIVKPKAVQPIYENFPEYFEDAYESVVAPENRTFLYIGLGVLSLVGIFLIRKIIK